MDISKEQTLDGEKERKKLKRDKQWKSLLRRLNEHKLVYLMIIPIVISLLVFSYYPMYGLVLAVKKFRPSLGILGSEWAQPLFTHFESVFATPYFWEAIKIRYPEYCFYQDWEDMYAEN